MSQETTPKPNKKRLALVGGVVVIAAVAAVVTGISSRAQTDKQLEAWTSAQATPTVATTQPTPNTAAENLTLPGTIQAYNTAQMFARVPGYVKTWNYDIGARVKKGDVLAEIDTPDLDQQLAQMRANMASAVANEKLSALTAVRWHQLLNSQDVSQQDADTKVTDAQAKQAALQAAQASVGQMEAMEQFKHIIAPFDGVVTARSAEIGALVSAGGGGRAMFQISDLHKVRIYVQMPQAYAADLRPGLTATLSLPQYPDKTFEATLATTANAFAEESRTVQVELQADNTDGKLWPGTFTEVTFHVPADKNILRVPSTALVFGARGMQVATVGPDSKVTFKPIQLGRDLGNDAQVLSGLSTADRVVLSPPEWLSDGDVVQVQAASAAPNGAAAPVKVAEGTAPAADRGAAK